MNRFAMGSTSKLVGLSGTLNAGKDTAAQYLVSEHGFMHVSSGDVLRVEAARQGRDDSRPTLIEIGVELRKQYGTLGAIVIRGIEQWQEQREAFAAGLVVSGLRVVGEAQEVKDQNGKLVFVDAPVEERYRRMVARSRDAEANMSFEEFVAHERVELEGLGGPERPHLRAVETISDVVLHNIDEQSFLPALAQALGLANAN